MSLEINAESKTADPEDLPVKIDDVSLRETAAPTNEENEQKDGQPTDSSKTLSEESSNSTSFKEEFLKTRRQSSQMDIFLNKFIKPRIKNSVPIPKPKFTRRTSKRQNTLNLLVVGEPGLGKDTFIRSLVNKNTFKKDKEEDKIEDNKKIIGNGIIERSFSLIKDGQKISLNLIEVLEYGCGMKSDSTFSEILNYVVGTFQDCFTLECSLNRTSYVDRKIHCCLYFISSYGHSLKPLDIAFLKLFQTKFNIIPVIGKSDIFTKSELEKFKINVLKDFEIHNINLFEYFDNSDSADDDIDNTHDMCDELKDKIPLTIISSNEIVLNNMKKEERLRKYPWGNLKIDDSEISHYSYLENLLLKSHINYFKTLTRVVHYENYRVQYILDHVN